MQKSFIFDVGKCTGCEACQIACSIENRVDPGIRWRRVYTFNPRRYPAVPSFHHSLACNHCVDPPCMNHCPALAFTKDAETGAVTVDDKKCIGCRYCSWACPYDAPQLNRAAGTIEKCTFCAHRLESGLEPTCVALCPTGALRFGDYEPNSDGRAPGFTATDIGPAIRFVGARAPESAPACSAADRRDTDAEVQDEPAERIGLRSEWTLMLFTLFAAALVGAYASTLFAVPFAFGRVFTLDPIAFFVVGVFSMAISTRHLGKPNRAWRAILNWRRSWLSREVLLFPAFLASGTAALANADSGGIGGWIPAAIGFAALFAMDRVYHVTRSPGLSMHSARVLLTGVLFAAMLSAHMVLFGLIAVVKTFLYLYRKFNFYRQHRAYRPWLTRTRVLIGLVAPMLIVWKGPPSWYAVAVGCVMVGELVDRCEFYLEIDAPSPARQMADDLSRRRQLGRETRMEGL